MLFGQQLSSHRIFKQLAKALIRLRICAYWSEPLLVAHTTLLEISCRSSSPLFHQHRRHTVAYVADSGRLYTFGSGILSQLGTGEKGVTTLPTRVKGPFLPHSLNHTQMDTDSGPMFVVHRIAAGGDHCFVIGTDPEVSDRPPDKSA